MLENNQADIYKKYMAFNEIMLESHDAEEIAAILVVQGLSFYRTFLDEDDYQKMVQSIYDQKDQVQIFEGPSLK